MTTIKDTLEIAQTDAIDWIARGAAAFAPEAFYRVVDDPKMVKAGATEGKAKATYPKTYRDEFAATVRQATRDWPASGGHPDLCGVHADAEHALGRETSAP